MLVLAEYFLHYRGFLLLLDQLGSRLDEAALFEGLHVEPEGQQRLTEVEQVDHFQVSALLSADEVIQSEDQLLLHFPMQILIEENHLRNVLHLKASLANTTNVLALRSMGFQVKGLAHQF